MRYQATTKQAPAQGPVTGLDALRQQSADLAQQLAGLKAQRVVIERQLRANNLDVGLEQRLAQRRTTLVEQITQVESDLASVRAQIASRTGAPVPGDPQIVIPPPTFNNKREADPEMVIGLSFALAMVFAIPLSIAWARRIWRGGKVQVVGPKMDEISPRLDRLEQAVDAIAIEIERISEGQRFVTKVLVDRPQQGSKGDDSAAPILALGAGPAEPVRKAERQTVRPSVTPH